MNPAEIAQVAHQAGFRDRSLVTAVAVAMAESAGRPGINAAGAEDSRGLWQINSVHFGTYDKQRLYQPGYNAKAAFEISDGGQNWQPWTAWTAGHYEKHLDDARRAVKAEPWRQGQGAGGDGGRGRNGDDGGGGGRRPRRRSRRRSELAPWRVPRTGAGRTGRIVVTPSFLDELARVLTGHLATVDEVDRGARHQMNELDVDKLVIADGLEGFVNRTARAAVEDHAGTRRLPALFTRDVGYVIEAHRRAVHMDADKAFGPKAINALVGGLKGETSRRTRERIRRLLRQLGPGRLPTTPRGGGKSKAHGQDGKDGGKDDRIAGKRPADVRLDRRWGGTQAMFEQLVTPLMQDRGLQPGSSKRGVIPGSSTGSDHYVGNKTAYAVDYPTTRGADDARAVARRLGIDGWRPDSYQSYHVRVGDERFRVQILWGAQIAHGDHVHVGIRRA